MPPGFELGFPDPDPGVLSLTTLQHPCYIKLLIKIYFFESLSVESLTSFLFKYFQNMKSPNSADITQNSLSPILQIKQINTFG